MLGCLSCSSLKVRKGFLIEKIFNCHYQFELYIVEIALEFWVFSPKRESLCLAWSVLDFIEIHLHLPPECWNSGVCHHALLAVRVFKTWYSESVRIIPLTHIEVLHLSPGLHFREIILCCLLKKNGTFCNSLKTPASHKSDCFCSFILC